MRDRDKDRDRKDRDKQTEEKGGCRYLKTLEVSVSQAYIKELKKTEKKKTWRKKIVLGIRADEISLDNIIRMISFV